MLLPLTAKGLQRQATLSKSWMSCEQEARHCAVNPIRLLRHTPTPFCRPKRGQGTYKNRVISTASQGWKARMSFMLKSLRVDVHTKPLWGKMSTRWPIRRGSSMCEKQKRSPSCLKLAMTKILTIKVIAGAFILSKLVLKPGTKTSSP